MTLICLVVYTELHNLQKLISYGTNFFRKKPSHSLKASGPKSHPVKVAK